jgi:hypothetical protein
MRASIVGCSAFAATLLGAALCATGASAASVDIKNAVARVTVIPEQRSDVQVTVVKDDPHRPLKVSAWPDGRTVVEGGYFGGGLFGGMGVTSCNSNGGRPYVRVFGSQTLTYDNMAQIVVRVPLDAHVAAGGAVFGEVGRSDSLDLHIAGCGDWVVANVKGRLSLSDTGSGDVHTGTAGEIKISTAGSGDVYTHAISNGVEANISGSSDIKIEQASGPMKVRISGSGDLGIGGGHASDLDVFIAGSGNVTYKGVADTVSAFVAGSGDVNVARVTGAVKKSIAGSGDVNIGR